jgi:lysophospholipase L1-like esterase
VGRAVNGQPLEVTIRAMAEVRSTTRGTTAVILVLLLILLLPAGTAVATGGSKLPAGSRYVAIGSSYAAGFGIRPLAPGSGSCGRSEIDYPHLVAVKLHLQLDDVSCGGAVTANALDTPQGSAPPQIDAVSPQTRLVTLTIGGNDVNYIGTAFACGQTNSTCTSTADPAQIDAAFRALPHSLTELIQAIRTKAPSAAVVLVTYPRLVPPSACPALHYSTAAARLVGSMGQRLEQVFVTVAKADHVRVADPYVLGAAHGPCANGTNKWVAGLLATNGFAYHPTAAGHQEMARLVEQALSGS